MGLLTKTAILQAVDLETKDIEVPEWGGTVRLASLTASQRDKYESSILDQRGKDIKINQIDMRAKLLAWCIIDEEGTRVFSQADVVNLGSKNAGVIDRLFMIAKEMSGIGDDEEEANVNEHVENLD